MIPAVKSFGTHRQVVPGPRDGGDLLGRVPLRAAGRRTSSASRRGSSSSTSRRRGSRPLAFFVAAWYSWRYLRKRRIEDDEAASAAARLGFLFCVLATVTGSIFAQRHVELVLELGPARDVDRPPPPRLRRVPRPAGRDRGPRAPRDALGGLRPRRVRHGAVPDVRGAPHVPVAPPRHRDQRPREGRDVVATSASSSSPRWSLSWHSSSGCGTSTGASPASSARGRHERRARATSPP